MISRSHVQIIHNDETNKTMIFDMRSLNGTFLNNKKVLCHEITSGDIIHFGGNKLKEGENFYESKSQDREEISSELIKNFGKNIIVYKFEKYETKKRKREENEEDSKKIQKVERKNISVPTINILENTPKKEEKKQTLDPKLKDLCDKFKCNICSNLIHKATAIQPCSHTFCKDFESFLILRPELYLSIFEIEQTLSTL
jgi:hypothetical protein